MEDKLKIKIRVAEKEFPMTIGRENEETIRKAAKAINDKIAKYRRQYDVSDPTDYLAMAALQTSIESLDGQQGNASAEVLVQLEALDSAVEEYLAQELI